MIRRLSPFLLVILAACAGASAPPLVGPKLAPAPLPSYTVGDGFTWDSGYRETVAAVRGDEIDWTDSLGNRLTTRRDFTLPPSAWDFPASSGSATVTPGSPSLWPLAPGKEGQSRDRGMVTRKPGNSSSSFAEESQCRVDGTETVTVPVGTFDTFKVTCRRYFAGGGMEETGWNYAPAVGHFVRRKYAGQEAENLLAYGPAPDAAARKLLEPLRQRTLESAPSGRVAEAGQAGAVVAVTPLRTFRTESGVFCRDYREEVTAHGRRSATVATACRQGGTWKTG